MRIYNLLKILDIAKRTGYVTRREIYDIGDKAKSAKILESIFLKEFPKGLARLLVEFKVSGNIGNRGLRYYLTDLGKSFDPENPPEPDIKPKWREPIDARTYRLAQARREKNREKWVKAKARNRKNENNPSLYKEFVADYEDVYTRLNGDLKSLPIAERIAILRSRTGVNKPKPEPEEFAKIREMNFRSKRSK